jgi:ankyrin repeat protein
MATWYERRDVVELLLDHGIPVDARDETEGHTALHIAAYQGSPGLVELLLRRGAAVNRNDRKYGTPPVVWALHAWLVDQRDSGQYPSVLRLLGQAGAELKPEWLDDDRIRAEPGLLAALQAH